MKTNNTLAPTICPQCQQSVPRYPNGEEGDCGPCGWKDIIEAEQRQQEADDAVMAMVKDKVCDADYQLIQDDLKESSWSHNFAIVEEATGAPDEELEMTHGRPVINQVVNGGYTGDDYAGDIYYPIGPAQFLKVSYVM